MNKIPLVVAGLLIATLVATTGCLQSSQVGITPITTGEADTLFTITDAPSDDYEEINLDIDKITLYGDGETTKLEVNQEINLKELENKVQALTQEKLQAQNYEKITMTLNKVTAIEDTETTQVELPAKEITVGQNTYLEEGTNSVEIDIPIETALQEENGETLFTPNIETRVRSQIQFTTSEGTQVNVQPGESVEIQGGHGNQNISIQVGEQGQQQVQERTSKETQERIQEAIQQGEEEGEKKTYGGGF